MCGFARSTSLKRGVNEYFQLLQRKVPEIGSAQFRRREVMARRQITIPKLVISSTDANGRNYSISEDLLWLERRCARRAGQIQSSIHRKGHYPESCVPLGNGNQEWTTALALCRNQRAHACRHQRRG